jgi:hypothetical protein
MESQCLELAKRRGHPDVHGKTVWEVYEQERAQLRTPQPLPGLPRHRNERFEYQPGSL